MTTTNGGNGKRSRWPLVLVAVLAAAGLAALPALGPNEVPTDDEDPLFVAKRGPLTISVAASGNIRSRRAVKIECEVEGSTTLLSIAEEGTAVKKGDLLVELDASALKDREVDQQITVDLAEASTVNAREYLEIVKKQGKADTDAAEVNLLLAKLDLEKYREKGGEYDQEIKKAKNEITKLEASLERARDKMEGSRRLYEKKYITENELKADELEFQRNELDKTVAEGQLELLERFTFKRRIAELTSAVAQAEFALEKARHLAQSELIDAKATYSAKQSQFDREKARLKKITRQIAKCRIVAPADGMVVYDEDDRRDQPLQEGVKVHEGQDLIRLPIAGQMVADVKIHESMLQKVKQGQAVRITTDANAGRVFEATLEKIAVMPDRQSRWLNPDLKVYNSEVVLKEEYEELRPGMSCNAEIIVEELDDAVHVPIQAVVRVGGKPRVYVMTGGKLVPREVRVGLDNNRMIHILSGLEEGERVSLTPPLQRSGKPSAEKPARDRGPADAGGGRPAGKPGPEAGAGKPSGERTGRKTGAGAAGGSERKTSRRRSDP